MNPVYEKLQGCLKSVREKTDFVPKVAIVLGSGLGDYANDIQVEAEVESRLTQKMCLPVSVRGNGFT